MNPRENPALMGHESAERMILDCVRAGRMHHAWLITGPEGIGKATLAYRFARRLLAGVSPATTSLTLDAADPVFRRVAAGTHADLLTVERTWDEKAKRRRKSIAAEDARKIPDFLHLTPAEDGWRVVIVDGAEDLNTHSANALLKVLEEPPRRAVLMLVCSAPGRLLPTIRSRCRHLRLAPLGTEVVLEVLAAALPDRPAAERAMLAALAEGAPGRALALAAEEGVRLAALADEVLAGLPGLPELNYHVFADRLGRDENAFGTFMEVLRSRIAVALRAASHDAANPEQTRIAQLRPLAAWGDVWQGLVQIEAETERFNLDKRQAMIAGLALLNSPC